MENQCSIVFAVTIPALLCIAWQVAHCSYLGSVLSHPPRNTVHLHDGDNLLHGHSKLIAQVLTYEDDLPIGRKLNWLIALIVE